MESYLTGRSHIRQNLSSFAPISYSVPQGSILGPLPFILFVNDLPLSTRLEIDMYADDSTLHTAGNSINELSTKITTALVGVHTWCTSNSMVINEKKTNTMVVCTRQ